MTVSIILIIVAILLVAFVLRNWYELSHLRTTRYEIVSDKVKKGDGRKAVLLADLHGRKYGPENRLFIERVAQEQPDVIFLAGDMMTSSRTPDFASLRALLLALLKIAPVFYSFGNHEKRMSLPESPAFEAWNAFQAEMEEQGVTFLCNESVSLNESITVSGLDIDFSYYNKVKRKFYEPEQMKKDLAEADRKRFNIVLAHNPRFFRTYAENGEDLFLAGHYHGGAVRIAGKIGVVSPQFRLFPRYSRGRYQKGSAEMIVTGGCGSHKVNLRIQNKPEVVVITIHGNLV